MILEPLTPPTLLYSASSGVDVLVKFFGLPGSVDLPPSKAASSASYCFKKSFNKYVLPYLILNSSAFLLIVFSKDIIPELLSSLVYFNFSKFSISLTNSLFIVCKNSF